MNQDSTDTGWESLHIWRYPVKINVGRGLNSSYVTERGLIGDRAYELIDQKLARWLVPRTLRNGEELFDFRSVFIDPLQVVQNIPPVRITFPDGTHIFSHQDNIDYTLSKALHQEC